MIAGNDPDADAPPDAVAAAGESTSAMKVAKALPVPPDDAVAVGGVLVRPDGVALALALPLAVAVGGDNVTLSSDPDALPAAPPDAVAVGPVILMDAREPLAAALPEPVAVGGAMVIASKLPDALPAPPADASSQAPTSYADPCGRAVPAMSFAALVESVVPTSINADPVLMRKSRVASVLFSNPEPVDVS